MDRPDPVLTVREAAARLRVSTKTIRRRIADGSIAAVKPLSDRLGWRIKASEIESLISGRKKEPAESEDPTG